MCSFDAAELLALAIGAQAERCFGGDLVAFALRKRRDPGFRVTAEHAMAGAHLPSAPEPELTLGQLLRVLELELIGIELVTDAEPATRAA